MDGSSSRDCNNGEEIFSSSSRKRRRAAKSILAKPKERRRGFGIAKLEIMRVEEEMKEYFKEMPSQAPNSGVGIQDSITYGTREDMNGESNFPILRSLGTYGATSYVNPSNTVPTTLDLFEGSEHMKDEYVNLKRKGDDNLSNPCKNFNDLEDLDLDLDLKL